MAGLATLRCAAALFVALFAACFAASVGAQGHEAPAAAAALQASAASAPAAAPLSAQLIKTGLYLITGGGGNSVLRLSANGYILVDSKLPGSYRALKSQVRKITVTSDLPIRAVVVTDHHASHTGNVDRFLADGIAVIAQENVKRHGLADAPTDLPLNGSSGGPSNGSASGAANQPTPVRPAPLVTYERSHTLRLGGVEVQLLHFGRAQTDDGTAVYFPNLKVVAVGDLFTPDTPDPDFAGGGSLVDWGPALAQLLALDFDVAVPGTGPTVGRAEIAAFKTRIDTLVARATALVNRGVPKSQLMAQLATDDLGWRLRFTGDQLDGFYDDLTKAR